MKKLTDQALLAKVAIEDKDPDVRRAALQKLTDQALLTQVGTAATDRDVLKIVFQKLDDGAILTRLAGKAADPAMRVAAATRAGVRTWDAVFIAASANPKALGDALEAAALYPDVQEEARSGVEQACVALIRRGDESRIPEMVDLLNLYGNTNLCEDYLNCGQLVLESAAHDWATARGYSVWSGSDSHRARWGSDR
ncbi:MAG: hypothetical protein ABR964_05120 [Tepidisphaeraceae bacterium]